MSQGGAMLTSILIIATTLGVVTMSHQNYLKALSNVKPVVVTVPEASNVQQPQQPQQQSQQQQVSNPPVMVINPPPQQTTVPTQVTIVPPGGLDGSPRIPYVSSLDTTWHAMGYVYRLTTDDRRMSLRLFGRRKYPRSERYEYYVLDKNDIRVVIPRRNDKELYNDDTVNIPELGGDFKVVIYPVQELVYNPFPITI